jgi:hypothetical protein
VRPHHRVTLVQVVEADEEILRFVPGDGNVLVWNTELTVKLICDLLRWCVTDACTELSTTAR